LRDSPARQGQVTCRHPSNSAATTGPARAAAAEPPPITPIALYCRLTLGFVIGLYLPWASAAPDLLRHFGEAVHSWVVIFFWPVAAWRLLWRAAPAADASREGQG
jgi:hypothetical protein